MFIEKVIIFFVFLGPLVFFHELGHFLFARLFGVRVEVFSLGFGPKLFKRKKNDTEYAISLIPLGGYVKMFGDDPMKKDEVPENEREHAFTHKSKWAKFWIVFGGPLANFILAYFIYFALLVGGEKVPEPKLGFIPSTSAYYQMGLRTADVLTKVNDKEILGFDDLNLVDTQINTITVKRGQEDVKVNINKESSEFIQDIMSFAPNLRAPVVTNLKGETFILSTKEKSYSLSDSLEDFARLERKEFYLYPFNIEKEEEVGADYEREQKIVFDSNLYEELINKYQLYPADLMVSSIVMGSPADKSKLKKGDIILKINTETLFGFNQLRNKIQELGNDEEVKIEYYRDSQLLQLSLKPEVQTIQEKTIKTIGVYSSVVPAKPRMVESSKKSFWDSLILSYKRTSEAMEKTVAGFFKLFSGEASLKSIGGPVAIAKVAADSLSISLSYFFRLMAIISINLGIINLFPIPVLDGGHIVFLILEVINRGPLSQRKMEIAQQFGVSLLLLLITFALYNDFSRLFG